MRTILLVTAPLILASALALAGCKKADTGPKTMEQAKKEAAQLERPAPGQYKQTATIKKFEVPGAPPQMVEQIRKMMESQNTRTICLSKADSDKGFEEMFKRTQGDNCKYDRFNASANTIDAIMVCDSGDGAKAKLTLNGTVSTTGSKVNVNVEQQGSKAQMGNATIAMEMETKRIGDCPAGAK